MFDSFTPISSGLVVIMSEVNEEFGRYGDDGVVIIELVEHGEEVSDRFEMLDVLNKSGLVPPV